MADTELRPSADEARRTMLGNSDLRRHNLAAVVRAVASSRSPSRASVARATGLTRTATSALVAQLVHLEVLVEDLPVPAKVGRPSPTLRLATSRFTSVTVEIQSASVSTVVSELTGGQLAAWKEPTHGQNPDDLMAVVVDQVRSALDSSITAGKAPLAVVVAVHGAVEPASARIVWSRDARWQRLDVATALREVAGPVPVIVENDATVAAIAEYHAAAATRSVSNLISISSDVGIGAGVIIGGKPYRGAHGFAGELGHMLLDPDGPECNCGRTGCWTAFVGLRNVLREALPDVAGQLENFRGYEDSAAHALLTAALDGDPRTLRTLHETGIRLGAGLGNVVNAFDPDVIVLGGYLVLLAPWVLEPARAELGRRALPRGATERLELTSIGTERVARGGLQLALERLVDDPLDAPPPVDGAAR